MVSATWSLRLEVGDMRVRVCLASTASTVASHDGVTQGHVLVTYYAVQKDIRPLSGMEFSEGHIGLNGALDCNNVSELVHGEPLELSGFLCTKRWCQRPKYI